MFFYSLVFFFRIRRRLVRVGIVVKIMNLGGSKVVVFNLWIVEIWVVLNVIVV